ncbi:hypothetical protein KDA_41560 [Dictyobacter alpinus]|uniref:Clp R domain-containing protein n=1 Tax=Dictyobacter alpinus TaxID=2014873 RepID=A0A402BBJ3_9CHLR|nr:zinc ribbon domain-containing protein [Dictyobacter alpinus]GCE28672.1 hypothetical protein KDA_41560 [Dictyobacter alpinus]
MSTKSPGQQSLEIDWLTPQTREIILLAQQEAEKTGTPAVQLEHLLLGVLSEGKSLVAKQLQSCTLDMATLRAHIDAVYANNFYFKEDNPPFSQAAEECVQNAIAMITYYLTRYRPSARVAANHLVLSVISHPGIQRLQMAHPTQIATLRLQITADMEPNFLRHSENLLHPPPAREVPKPPTWKRANTNVRVHCPSCQRPIQANWKYCTYCGHHRTKVCPNCSAPSPAVADARFCIECGHHLDP